jgi:hypothetical protein
MASSNDASKDELSGASSEEDLAQVSVSPSLKQEEKVRLRVCSRTKFSGTKLGHSRAQHLAGALPNQTIPI